MKEELPSILISDGWETDENDNLVEVVVPSTVDTYQAPTKVTFKGDTLNWIPSNATTLQEFEAPNMQALTTSVFHNYTQLKTVRMGGLKSLLSNIGFGGCTALTTVSMPALESITVPSTSAQGGAFGNCSSLSSVSFSNLLSIAYTTGSNSGHYNDIFGGCTALTTVDMPKLETVSYAGGGNSGGGLFPSCTALTTVNMPKLKTVSGTNGGIRIGMFYGCTGLSTIELPSLSSMVSGTNANSGHFTNCTGLTSVTLGSTGHPVTSLGNYTFGNCTQAGLTITIYTTGGAALSGEPWGATNATIVYESA